MRRWVGRLTAALLCLAGGMAPAARAGTIAYYRFENGSDFLTATSPIADQTGAFPLTVEGGSDARYRAAVPLAVVPQTKTPDALSMEFSSLAAFHSTGAGFNTFAHATWTVEAFVMFKSLSGFQTFVGKDGSGAGVGDFYLQRNDRNGAFSVFYATAPGVLTGFDGNFKPAANTWYHVAAVDDGSTLSLYVNGVLDRSVPVTAPMVVENTAWAVGRGYFSGPSDPSHAFVDEVRFSDAALSPSLFLDADAPAVPEPGTLLLLGSGVCVTLARRTAGRFVERRKSAV
jgi:hypothetical protein